MVAQHLHEQRALIDLPANGLIPGITPAGVTFVKSDLDACRA
jgi:hypothetical protein